MVVMASFQVARVGSIPIPRSILGVTACTLGGVVGSPCLGEYVKLPAPTGL